MAKPLPEIPPGQLDCQPTKRAFRPTVRAFDFGMTERNAVPVHYVNLLAVFLACVVAAHNALGRSLWRLSLNTRSLTPSISIRAAPQHEEAPVTEIEAVHNAQVVEEAQLATAPPSGGDPVPLGLLVFALGSTVLGISLLGYVPLAVQGNTIMPIVFAATGLGLLITTIRRYNDLIDCPVGPWKVAAPLRLLLPTTPGYGHRLLPAVRVERFVGRRAE
jgi:hypothetical protein